jgi:Protein of unknown function (DUF4038)/Putative collagen-binding domain of a collagenase
MFKGVEGKFRGILRVDPGHPWHSIWESSGEHCFVNGTTAFLLMGWDSEQMIRDCIDRLHGFKVNRIRVLLDGRTDHFWTEPISPGNGFRAHLNPWEAERPDDVRDPGFDYTRFNCPYWQKFERMLKYARDKDMTVSVVFLWNDTKVHPVAGSADERLYFYYAAARLAAYANITWDLGDDIDSFRNKFWTRETGTMLYRLDPYHHLATSHPVHNEHQDRTSEWFAMTSFQRKAEPHDELVSNGAFCLAEIGTVYVVYLPHGGDVNVKVDFGRYEAKWFNPRTGEYSSAGSAEGRPWQSPPAPDNEDWVLMLERT